MGRSLFTVRSLAPPLGAALANALLSAAAYGSLPETVIIHWNAAGAPDGYAGKVWVALMPSVSLLILGLFVIIPRIDPSGNIGRFRGAYLGLMTALQLYMLFFNGVFIAQNLGYAFNIVGALAVAIGPLFYYLGTVMGKAERNWFVGIRTPWTLSDDDVWASTHKMAGRLFKACGGLALVGVAAPAAGVWIIVFPLLLSTMYLFWYSYAEFQRKKRLDPDKP